MSSIIKRLAAGLCLLPGLALADYSDNPATIALMEQLVAEEGFDRAQLEAVFASASRQDKIIEAMDRPAEKALAWYEYRALFMNDKRISRGVDFYGEHRQVLERAERETGVPAAIIVAIIGVETHYGRITGSYRVIDSLSTLAFDYPRRSEYFTRELVNYLVLTREQGVDPLAIKGSYAGAMGYGQFMPSSYRSYAVDFDGDGLADLWGNPADAIGSVANYFVGHGWRPGEAVILPMQPPSPVPEELVSTGRQLAPDFTVADYREAGFELDAGLPADAPAIGMAFEMEAGPEYWLALKNFYVITRYNHSAKYAMAVYQLSEAIAAGVAE